MTLKIETVTQEVPVKTSHVCNRCGVASTSVNVIFTGILPSGWSHLTYVVPAIVKDNLISGALDDNKEFDFCYTCTDEIMNHR